MVRYILTACGPVLSWKRISAFGFCEFSSPEAGLRCVRLLHDRQLGDKKMVAKVDAKTKDLLDRYKSTYFLLILEHFNENILIRIVF